MKIVSIINYKGGVGKTSLTANLGAELAWRGKRVLLLDLDAQASLTFSFIEPDKWSSSFASSKTIKSWFDAMNSNQRITLSSLVHKPSRIAVRILGNGELSIIPSHLGLINVDLELATRLGGANLGQAKRNFIEVHKKLSDGLESFNADGDYDIILIDCPPNFNIVTRTAIIASNYILVPTRADELSTLGMHYLMRSVKTLLKDYNDYVDVESDYKVEKISPSVVGVVFTMIQEYGGKPILAQQAFINKVKRESELTIFNSYIKRNDTLFAGAPVYGIPLVLNGYSNTSHQSVVDGLVDVTTEFSAILGI